MAALLNRTRLTALALAMALLLAVGATGIAADAAGQPLTPAAHACNTGSSGGGGC